VAKLSGEVNIAVFAAFWPRVGRIIRSSAEFKRFAGIANLTFRVMGGKSGKIAARNGNKMAKGMAKTARFGLVAVTFMRDPCRDARGCTRVSGGFLALVCGCQGAGGARWRRGDRTKTP
jgi:hypothetical protein